MIYPHRSKRGLVNFLGSGIKFITGNMDYNDARKITSDIRKLKSYNQNLIIENNKQIKINQDIEDKINNITFNIQIQQQNLRLIVNKTDEMLIKDSNKINFLISFNLISNNIDLLQYHLNSILQSINLAKLQLIPQNILSIQEIAFIYEILQNQSLEISALEEIYEYCTLEALYNGTNIIFNIKIPILAKNIFDYMILEPIPTKNNLEMKILSKFVLKSENQTLITDEKCPRIGFQHLCSAIPVDLSDNCVENLLEGQSGTCTYTSSQEKQIKLIWPGHVLIKHQSSTKISGCSLQNLTIQGTNLIKFFNCTMTIDGHIFYDKNFFHSGPSFVLPTYNIAVLEKKIDRQFSTLDLSNLHLENRKQIKELQRINQNHHIIVYIIIAILTTVLLIFGLMTLFKFSKLVTSNILPAASIILPEPNADQGITPNQPSLLGTRRN